MERARGEAARRSPGGRRRARRRARRSRCGAGRRRRRARRAPGSACSRSLMPGAVMMLPFDASGFAPRISMKRVRSTSGIGKRSWWPNMKYDGERGAAAGRPRSPSSGCACRSARTRTGASSAGAVVVHRRVSEVASRPRRGRAASGPRAGRRPRRRAPRPTRPVLPAFGRCAGAGARRRSGSSWSSASAGAFGQMWPRLNGSSSSPRTRDDLAAFDVDGDAAHRLAQVAGPEVGLSHQLASRGYGKLSVGWVATTSLKCVMSRTKPPSGRSVRRSWWRAPQWSLAPS